FHPLRRRRRATPAGPAPGEHGDRARRRTTRRSRIRTGHREEECPPAVSDTAVYALYSKRGVSLRGGLVIAERPIDGLPGRRSAPLRARAGETSGQPCAAR